VNAIFDTPSARKARIEIIPLLAVLFFLLATFAICTASLKRTSVIEQDIGGEWDWSRRDSLAVSIQAADAGVFYWKMGNPARVEEITAAELPARLAEYKRTTKEPMVLIRGDREATFGSTVLILDEARKAGIDHVSFESHLSPTGL